MSYATYMGIIILLLIFSYVLLKPTFVPIRKKELSGKIVRKINDRLEKLNKNDITD